MLHSEAIALIKEGVPPGHLPQVWADLGCGKGTFTLALAELLSRGSLIHAVDTDSQSLESIPVQYEEVSIKKWETDFTKDYLPFDEINGLLMANSLHFVAEKEAFLKKLTRYFLTGQRLLIIEYDTDRSNTWVPYPLSFTALETLCRQAGFPLPQLLSTQRSRYHQAGMYAALILDNG